MELKISDKTRQYAGFSNILQETLEIEGNPVAIAISSTPPEKIKQFSNSATVCIMLQRARNGDTFWTSGKRILCGARVHLGIGKTRIPCMEDFLVWQEKLFKSRLAARHLLTSLSNMAPRAGNHLIFSPLREIDFEPNVVVFVATPAQVGRILFLDAYETGEFDLVHQEPLCSGSIAIPITTGKIGISFLDMACRFFGKYKPEEMTIGVPFTKLVHIINNIRHSTAGSAKPTYLMKLAGTLLRKRSPDSPVI
jgi:uncharacterized protein (DUF169 family)